MHDVIEQIRQLVDVDVDCCDPDELATAVTAARRVRGWLDTFDLHCTRRSRNLAAEGRSEAPESMHTRHGGRSSRESAAVTDRETVGAAMPEMEAALETGEVSSGHLDAVANAARKLAPELRAELALHEHELAEHAKHESVDTFSRRCRNLARQIVADSSTSDADELDRQREQSEVRDWTDKVTGMVHLHAELDPLRGEKVRAALQRAIDARRQVDGNARTPWQQLKVDAFVDAIGGGAVTDDLLSTEVLADLLGATVDNIVGRNTATSAHADASTNDVERSGDTTLFDPAPDTGPPDTRPAPAGTRHAGTPPPGSVTPTQTGRPPAVIAEMCRRIDARVPEVALAIDWQTLRDDLHAHGLCETLDGAPLPVSTVRRLCCDAEIIPVVLDGDGRPLDVGRSKRTATPEQRVALAMMYRTCAHPQCTVPFSQTRIHHVKFWTRDGGLTDLDNLIPLCERHHHLVHEGGWTLTMTSDRVTTWTRPDGTIALRGDTSDRHTARSDSQTQARAPAA